MKRAFVALLTVCILISGLSINVLADEDLSKFNSVLKEVEKKLWAGEQQEGKHMTGIKSNGDPIYTVYPTITDAMMKPLIEDYIQKLKNKILDLGKLSQAEVDTIINIYKKFDYRPIYYWSEKKVALSIYPEPDLYPIVEAREKAAAQKAADAFFKGASGLPSAWAKPSVQQAIEKGIVPESLMGNYQQPLTREEFAALFAQMVFTWQENEKKKEPRYYYSKEEYLANIKVTDYNFTDVNNPDVKLAYTMGLLNGITDTTIAPKNKMTRQEAAVMLVNYFQYDLSISVTYPKLITDLNKAAPWAKNAVSISFVNELLSGGPNKMDKQGSLLPTTMDPLGYFTREQAIAAANYIYQKNRNIHIPLMIRGTVDFDSSVEYVVSKNSVTAVKLKEDYFKKEKGIIAKNLLTYGPFREAYAINKAEQIEAMTLGNFDLATLLWSEMGGALVNDMMEWTGHGYGFVFPINITGERKATDAIFNGENHLLDLGWSTVEINGKDFIYKYSLKNNGFHSYHYYWDKELLPIPYKLIR